MKNMKRFSVLLLVCVFVLLGAGTVYAGGGQASKASAGTVSDNFNATGFPIVKQPVTKHFMLSKPPHISDPATMVTFQRYEQMSGVKVEWEVVPSEGFAERVNLVMASNTMPDAILKGTPDIVRTSADGSIIDLTSLIDKYAPGVKDLFQKYPSAKQASMAADGKIYALGTINTLEPNRTGHRNLWINKVWLDKLGLKAPGTIEEFIDVLRAFRDKDVGVDPSTKIPYVVENTGAARVNIFLDSWGIATNLGYGYMYIKDDKVHFLGTAPEYKEVLQLMNLMWKEKLLDNALYTQTYDVSLSKFNSSISGCFGLSSDDLWSNYSKDYIPLPPPKHADITPVIGLDPVQSGFSFVITKMDKNPEITMRWLDYFYTDEGSRFIGGLSPLLEGVTCQKLPDGSWDYSDAILNSPKGASMAVGDMCPLPGGGFPYWRNENNSNYIYSNKVKSSVPIYQPYYQKTPAYSYPVFSVSDASRVNDIRRDLDVYLAESQAKFITGDLSFDKWDEYTATCEKMYCKELENFFQAAYEKMK